jgi:hypothetical protein
MTFKAGGDKLAAAELIVGLLIALLVPPLGLVLAMRMLVTTRRERSVQRAWCGVYALAWVMTLPLVLLLA